MMVHLGHKISMYYFSCSGGPSVVSIKSPLQNFLSGLRFLHLVDLWVTVLSGTSWAGKYPVGHVMPDMCFLCLGGNGTGYTKSMLGHVTLNLCFCIQWDLRFT
jgi:hypothetical protein